MKAGVILIIMLAMVSLLSAQQPLDITLTPVNPPIIIPAQGGSFQFIASVVNHGPQIPFYIWAGIPMAGVYVTLLGPVHVNPPPDLTISRLRTQNIPGSWPPDVYFYKGYANLTYSQPALDSSIFTFIKLGASNDGPFVWDANCIGDPFPGGEFPPLLRGERGDLVTASPNPFNPTTTISYELQAGSYVSLKVYDTAGRLVTTLVEGWRGAGTHEMTFEGSKLASGIYLARLETGEFTGIQKLVLIK
jgi:hypothetical protein